MLKWMCWSLLWLWFSITTRSLKCILIYLCTINWCSKKNSFIGDGEAEITNIYWVPKFILGVISLNSHHLSLRERWENWDEEMLVSFHWTHSFSQELGLKQRFICLQRPGFSPCHTEDEFSSKILSLKVCIVFIYHYIKISNLIVNIFITDIIVIDHHSIKLKIIRIIPITHWKRS